MSNTLSEEQILAQIRDAASEAVSQVYDHFAEADQRREAAMTARRPYDAAAELDTNPIFLVTRALQRQGLSEAQILDRLAKQGLGGFEKELNEELEIERREQARAAAIKEAQSPEARIKEARNIEATRAEQSRQAQLARLYLDENSERLGLPADANELISDAEAITIAFGGSSSEGGES